MFTTFINKKMSSNFVFATLLLILVMYILLYAYNAKQNKTQNLIETDTSVKCISNICLTYNNIKECIHIEVPTLFRIETIEDINFLRTDVRSVDYISIKEDCR